MKSYTVKKIGKIGDHDPKYGQRWRGSVEEAQMEISFNTMEQIDFIPEGAKLEFEERLIKETKGSAEKPPREYMQLKKVRVSGGTTKPEAPQASSSLEHKIDQILEIVKELRGEPDRTPDDYRDEETVVTDIGDDPIDLSEIPF